MRVESQGEAHRGQSLRQLIHNATASLGPVQPADPRLPRLSISSTPSPPPPHHPTPLATGPEPPYVWTYCRHRGRSSGLVTNASSRRNTALTAFPSHCSPSGFFSVLVLVPNKIMWLHCCCFLFCFCFACCG